MNSPGGRETAGKAPYGCDRCGRTFNTPEDLREHEKSCKGPEQIRQPMKPMEPQRISADEAKVRLDRGEPIAFVDARNARAWVEAEVKLPGAIRVPADDIDPHIDAVPHDRTVIAYCT